MYNLKQIITGAAFALFTGLATMSGNVIASTPDGETPANEGVCDSVMGASPGLYGLCVAYCEAQDLDSYDKNPPSIKILANYNKKKQAGDPDMPCDRCFTQEQINDINPDTSACSPQPEFRTGEWIEYGSVAHSVRADTRETPSCGYKTLVPFEINSVTVSFDKATEAVAAMTAKCVFLGK